MPNTGEKPPKSNIGSSGSQPPCLPSFSRMFLGRIIGHGIAAIAVIAAGWMVMYVEKLRDLPPPFGLIVDCSRIIIAVIVLVPVFLYIACLFVPPLRRFLAAQLKKRFHW